MSETVLPLSGLRVIDLSQGIAGPSAAMYCARWGADVIKVEPLSGDWIRGLGSHIRGDFSASALAYNGGKRSLAIDLKHPQAGAVMTALLQGADAVIESFRPGVATRLGVGFDAVEKIRPDIVYLSISGFGATGPMATKPCTDTVAQAYSGFMSLNLDSAGVPQKLDTTIIDALTGLYAYQALSMHLLSAGGRGQHLDVSLMESAAAILAPNILQWSLSEGAQSVLNAPAGTYQTANGWIAITLVRGPQFVALTAALDRPELAEDERFCNFEQRAANLNELRQIIGDIVVQQKTQFWQQRLTQHDVLTSEVHDIGQWLEHEQVQARDAAPMTALADGIDLKSPKLPGRGVESEQMTTSPAIGQHSREVLLQAGFNENKVDELINAACVGMATETPND